MTNLLPAVWLGIVEGITEFLPVSSTGHLIIAGNLLNFTGPKADTFEVVIQLGAILAVVVLYWERFIALLKPREDMRFSGIRGLWLLFLTSLPASVLGLLLHNIIKNYLFTPVTVGLALGIGALFILYIEKRTAQNGEPDRFTSLDDVTPSLALSIGLFQCLALWPGFSRSAATIMGGMIMGTKRSLAAEYSFIAAVPIMFAATGYDMLKSYSLFTSDDMLFLSIGFIVSFIAAWAAVKTFITLVGRMTFRPFAWYRLILAPFVLYFWS